MLSYISKRAVRGLDSFCEFFETIPIRADDLEILKDLKGIDINPLEVDHFWPRCRFHRSKDKIVLIQHCGASEPPISLSGALLRLNRDFNGWRFWVSLVLLRSARSWRRSRLTRRNLCLR